MQFACASRSQAGVDGREDGDVRESGGQRGGTSGIALDNGSEADRRAGVIAAGEAELLDDAEVVAAEGAGADDSKPEGAQGCGGHQLAADLAFHGLEAAGVELQ